MPATRSGSRSPRRTRSRAACPFSDLGSFAGLSRGIALPSIRNRGRMMDTIVKVGAVAHVDPDPSAELAAWHQDIELGRIDEPAVTKERLDAQAGGEQMIVRLGLFAEVLSGEAVIRYDGP